MTNSFYKGLDGVLLVFDVCDERSFDNLTKWLSQINQIKPCPYFIAGNKADMVHDRVIDDESVAQLEHDFNSRCFLTSAVTGMGVEEAFHTLINVIVPEKMVQLGHRMSQVKAQEGRLSLETVKRGKKKRGKCCK